MSICWLFYYLVDSRREDRTLTHHHISFTATLFFFFPKGHPHTRAERRQNVGPWLHHIIIHDCVARKWNEILVRLHCVFWHCDTTNHILQTTVCSPLNQGVFLYICLSTYYIGTISSSTQPNSIYCMWLINLWVDCYTSEFKTQMAILSSSILPIISAVFVIIYFFSFLLHNTVYKFNWWEI